ncbi:MAG: endonuclease/exonuclease/phosphatase family protein [Thermodesulfobacteriota bacterium]|nr:endonuclease/exonuclease/phosphatase family protein [Thermodesulfobacteriota bacterium]
MINNLPTDNQTLFSVMTINVRFGLADSGAFRWENRKPAFESLFHDYRPDFIALQENNDFQVDFFKTLLADYQFIGRRTPAPRRWQHLLIFYRHPWECRQANRFFLSHTPQVPSRIRGSKWPRQCVMGEFVKDNNHIVCVNTHFDFDPEVQEKSAGILLDQLDTFTGNNYPQIVMGDFNAAPGSRCHNAFTRPLQSRRPPFTDTFDGDVTGTFHDFTGEPLSERVDWVLHRNQLQVVDREIVTRRFGDVFPSDHFPVYVRFACIPQ